MDKKREFNDALSSLVEKAADKGNILDADEVKAAFDGIIDYEQMKDPVIKYLTGQGISISGITDGNKKAASSAKQPHISELEKNFVEMYKEDIKRVDILDEEQHIELIRRHISSENLLNELAEQNLHLVMNIVDDFSKCGLTMGDMIQEGNLGLIEGISCYDGDADIEQFRTHLTGYITDAINDAIDEQNSSSRIGNHIADRANALDHASTELAKDLEREPTLAELSEYLSLDEDEVERVMKMSLDALTIEGEE